MRAKARDLDVEADRITNSVRPLPELVPSWTFFAPAGKRLRGHLSDVHHRGIQAAGIVRAAADTLRAQAANLERDIARWEEEKRAEDRRIEEERQRAGQH
jgi:hypothetical protein